MSAKAPMSVSLARYYSYIIHSFPKAAKLSSLSARYQCYMYMFNECIIVMMVRRSFMMKVSSAKVR